MILELDPLEIVIPSLKISRSVIIYTTNIVRYGKEVEKGFISVFSVWSEDEAHKLLTLLCPLNYDGEFVAPESAIFQTIERLTSFSDLLERVYNCIQGGDRESIPKILGDRPNPLYEEIDHDFI